MRCFQPPEMIIVPLTPTRDACQTKPVDDDDAEDVPFPDFQRRASKEMSECGKPLRWLPMESDQKCQALCSVPRFPRRQASFRNHASSDAGSCLSRSSGDSAYSWLSECEQLSIEILEMFKDLECERSQAGASSRQSRGNRSHFRRGSRCSTDHQSIKSATLPRRPYRQKSFGRQEKRWSACTADLSCDSVPDAPSDAKTTTSSTITTAPRGTMPKMPRRQKSGDVQREVNTRN
ncbi:expressed unknown protein [Seminavis robusta]|uniref:Uncharacterized protein n=1 Tax=Seminavis robusta TaxID=568900 RepID=A0A9N8DJT7_9STRA|nr:expressed unknown protein [Seminavis robusta]|eukprot:Sro124_g059970.1 n/a (234) ;mRNA; r:80679-81380